MSKRTGLPEAVGLRPRDRHYVAGLVPEEPGARQRMIPTAQIHPNPDQPRQRIGALDPLATSIRDQGVLQPILVRRLGPKDFQIIAGERRYRAAVLAGLREVPCVERDAGAGEAMELALVENILRDDLSPFEEAAAYEGLIREHGHTHESLARRVGKPRTSITETLALLNIPEEIRELCWASGVRSRRQLLRVAREPDMEAMAQRVRRIARGMDAGAPERPKGARTRARPFVFRYAPKGGRFRLQMTFRHSTVEDAEVVEALRDLLRQLEASGAGGEPSSSAGADVDAPTSATSATESNT